MSDTIFKEKEDRQTDCTPDIFPAYLNSIGKVRLLTEKESRNLFREMREKELELLKDLCQIKGFVQFLKASVCKLQSKEIGLPDISNHSFGYHPAAENDDSYHRMVAETLDNCQDLLDLCEPLLKKPRIDASSREEIFLLTQKINLNFKLVHQYIDASASKKFLCKKSEVEQLRKKFIEANLRLVVSVAKRYKNPHLTLLDLVQEGNLGLIKAMNKFDPEKGYLFSTYAIWWIRQSINRALQNLSCTIRMPAHMFQKNSRLYKLTSGFSGENLSEDELADKLGVTKSVLGKIQEASQIKMKSMQEPSNDHDTLSLGDTLQSEFVDPTKGLSEEELRTCLSDLLSRLAPKEQEVIRLRFGLDGNEPEALRDIGKKLGLSGERIRQIQNRAIRTLRRPSGIQKLSAFYHD